MIHKDFQCEFYLIRHGETPSDPRFAIGADADPPLTPRGVEQARLLGRRLKREDVQFDRVYSSTLLRTVQTTETMLDAMGQPDREFTKVEALVEQRVPAWRGVPREEVFTPETLAYIRGKGSHFVPPEGESHRTVERRVAGWIEDKIIYNDDLVGKAQSLRVAIMGHETATKCLLHYIMGYDERMIVRMGLKNCSISRALFNHEGWSVLGINDACHLDGG